MEWRYALHPSLIDVGVGLGFGLIAYGFYLRSIGATVPPQPGEQTKKALSEGGLPTWPIDIYTLYRTVFPFLPPLP